MLAREKLPILEFIGGHKNRDSVYTKLLSKQETIAAQIYDKLRFRLVAHPRRHLSLCSTTSPTGVFRSTT
ncbi:MAG: hypothetical protein R3A78_15795 [Polyangiales bacterium]